MMVKKGPTTLEDEHLNQVNIVADILQLKPKNVLYYLTFKIYIGVI